MKLCCDETKFDEHGRSPDFAHLLSCVFILSQASPHHTSIFSGGLGYLAKENPSSGSAAQAQKPSPQKNVQGDLEAALRRQALQATKPTSIPKEAVNGTQLENSPQANGRSTALRERRAQGEERGNAGKAKQLPQRPQEKDRPRRREIPQWQGISKDSATKENASFGRTAEGREPEAQKQSSRSRKEVATHQDSLTSDKEAKKAEQIQVRSTEADAAATQTAAASHSQVEVGGSLNSNYGEAGQNAAVREPEQQAAPPRSREPPGNDLVGLLWPVAHSFLQPFAAGDT